MPKPGHLRRRRKRRIPVTVGRAEQSGVNATQGDSFTQAEQNPSGGLRPFPQVEQKTSDDLERRVQFWTAVMLMLFGIVAVAAIAFLQERIWGSEEPTLLNAPYTFEHFGQISFPVYGYNFEPSFHRLFVHPPTHYMIVGLLMRVGIGLYYAEAIPPVVFTIICMVLILQAKFPPYVTLGWMIGLISGMGWLASVGSSDFSFHLRPDTHMALACLAGLLVLEGARARHWDSRWLFCGALLLVYGSTVHYSGLFGWLGISVYMFLAWRALSWRRLLKPFGAILAGCALVGVPFLYFHVVRNWPYLLPWFTYAEPKGHWVNTIRANYGLYQGVARLLAGNPLRNLIYAFPLNAVFARSFPPFVFAAVMLSVPKSTRAVAIASLPTPLFLFFIFSRKLASYLYLEALLFLVGMWLLIAWLWMSVSPRFLDKWKIFSAPMLAILFAAAFATTTPALKGLKWDLEPRWNELSLTRAAAKEVVGSHALTASMHPYWYFSGGSTWYDLTGDLFVHLPTEDLKSFWSRFDAIAVGGPEPWGTQTGWTEAALYQQGILRLRGFENLRAGNWARWVWLTGRNSHPVTGFFWKDTKFLKFVESNGGDYTLVSVALPYSYSEIISFVRKLGALEYWPLDLPRKSGDAGWVLVLLFDSGSYHGLPEGQTPLEMIHGRAQPVEIKSMLKAFNEKQDQIEFEESYPELLRHFAKETGKPGVQLDWRSIDPQAGSSSPTGGLTLSAKSIGTSALAVSEARSLEPDAWYKANLDFKLDTGSVMISLLQEGTPALVTLPRAVPQAFTPESFVFRAPPGPAKTYLMISANGGTTPKPVRFAVKTAVLEQVELTR